MSLEVAVAVPFRQKGTRTLGEGQVVVALSLDRDWFSPDQAKRLVDIALARGLLEEIEGGEFRPTFDPDDTHVPDDFAPDESILREQSTFEQALNRLVSAGMDKQEAVAAANKRQKTLGVTIEAAAILVARERGIDVDTVAETVAAELEHA